MNELPRQAREAYTRNEFYEAHELWEDVWRDVTDPQERLGWQGLILVAVGLYKVRVQGKPKAGARLLRRAADRLGRGPASLDGIDLRALAATALDVAGAIDTGVRDVALPLPPVA